MTLDDDDIEAIAQRVAELVGGRTRVGLVGAKDVAEGLGVSTAWVYENARKLGAIKLGDGPKARLRFDLERARQVIEDRQRAAIERLDPRASQSARRASSCSLRGARDPV
jgi:hypothetical protein